MPVSMKSLGLDRLNTVQILEIAEDLSYTLVGDEGPLEIPDWHWPIIEQRLAECDANPDSGRPWREVMDEIDARQAGK